jgi:hypothetical protein
MAAGAREIFTEFPECVLSYTLDEQCSCLATMRRPPSGNQSVLKMVGSIGMRRGFINRGDWSDGLERQGSNPWPTTKTMKGRPKWGFDCIIIHYSNIGMVR